MALPKPDAELTSRELIALLQDGQCVRLDRLHAARRCVEPAAQRRRDQSLAVPVEQRNRELGLQIAHELGNGRLRHPKPPCCGGKAAGLEHRIDRPDARGRQRHDNNPKSILRLPNRQKQNLG